MTERLAQVEDTPESLHYTDFRRILRFAAPVSSLLEFRKRLVQRYGTIKNAFKVFEFSSGEGMSVDLFEKPMLAAGIVHSDAHGIFRAADAIQCDGPRYFFD